MHDSEFNIIAITLREDLACALEEKLKRKNQSSMVIIITGRDMFSNLNECRGGCASKGVKSLDLSNYIRVVGLTKEVVAGNSIKAADVPLVKVVGLTKEVVAGNSIKAADVPLEVAMKVSMEKEGVEGAHDEVGI
ncbi:uncharacterized protein A4U43_C08F32920 [Asparagus officinalis]|nr:uncharacterized protein A4U43_C08F32920 [Asparagus officinalis]